MQREIKFRGKRLDNGEWVYGCYTYSKKAERHLIWIQSEDNTEFWHTYPFEVYPSTVGQYTGLKDKNGKEIYEGDIVCFAEWSRGEMCWKGSIHFDYCLYFVRGGKNKECDTTFEIQLSRIPSERIEVIGNIFDNPELLKEVSDEA